MLDKLGQEIKVGSWIIYGHAIDRSAALRIGVVLATKEQDGRLPWLREDRITVWGLNDDHVDYAKHNPNDSWSKPRALKQKSTLMFPSRIVVVPEAVVPEEYRKLLQEKLPMFSWHK